MKFERIGETFIKFKNIDFPLKKQSNIYKYAVLLK